MGGELSTPESPRVPWLVVDDEGVELERLVAERTSVEEARLRPGFGREAEARRVVLAEVGVAHDGGDGVEHRGRG